MSDGPAGRVRGARGPSSAARRALCTVATMCVEQLRQREITDQRLGQLEQPVRVLRPAAAPPSGPPAGWRPPGPRPARRPRRPPGRSSSAGAARSTCRRGEGRRCRRARNPATAPTDAGDERRRRRRRRSPGTTKTRAGSGDAEVGPEGQHASGQERAEAAQGDEVPRSGRRYVALVASLLGHRVRHNFPGASLIAHCRVYRRRGWAGETEAAMDHERPVTMTRVSGRPGGSGSTSARRPASARPAPCSTRGGAGSSEAPTSWSATSRRTSALHHRAAPRPSGRAAQARRVPGQRLGGDGPRGRRGPPARGGPDRRVGPHQRAGIGSPTRSDGRTCSTILDAGIAVITTVNIQHIESLSDAVERITGVSIRERVPDWVVRRADQIELIDSSADQLRRRMLHGNIYPAAKVPSALIGFFRLENLVALRELSLRFVADETEEELLEFLRSRGCDGHGRGVGHRGADHGGRDRRTGERHRHPSGRAHRGADARPTCSPCTSSPETRSGRRSEHRAARGAGRRRRRHLADGTRATTSPRPSSPRRSSTRSPRSCSGPPS